MRLEPMSPDTVCAITNGVFTGDGETSTDQEMPSAIPSLARP